jgi:Spy/CpxP family protein refolding chaperone
MKKLTGFLLAGSLALGFPLLALAQDQDTAPTDSAAASQADQNPSLKGGGGQARHGGWKGQDAFKQKYALTDDQSAKLKDLFKTHREEAKPLQEKMKVEIDTLRLDVDSNASESQLKTALDKLSADKKLMRDSQEQFQAKLQAILTPKQQAQMLLAMGAHKGGWGRRGMGMGRSFGHGKPADGAPADTSNQP